jgi:hypothetical protein
LDLVAQSEFAVLKVNLFEVASINGIPESHNLTMVGMSSILISCPVNLVKIVRDEPSCSGVRLHRNQLRKEDIL